MEAQEIPEFMGNPYSSPMNNYGSSIITLTNPENELHRIELTLRNVIEGDNGDITKVGEPLLNEKGIKRVLGITQSMVNQVSIMSNFSKNEIPSLMDFVNDTVCRALMINRYDWDIKDSSARDEIYFTIMSYCFVTLKRGYEEGDRRFWKGSQQDIRTEVVSDANKSQSWIKAALGMGR